MPLESVEQSIYVGPQVKLPLATPEVPGKAVPTRKLSISRFEEPKSHGKAKSECRLFESISS
jgi:hypothetical protein